MRHCFMFCPEQLVLFNDNGSPINFDWKGVHTDFVHVAGCSINDKVHVVHKLCKVACIFAYARASKHIDKATCARYCLTIKDCSSFCLEQLSNIVGACMVHNVMNKHSAPHLDQNLH